MNTDPGGRTLRLWNGTECMDAHSDGVGLAGIGGIVVMAWLECDVLFYRYIRVEQHSDSKGVAETLRADWTPSPIASSHHGKRMQDQCSATE